MPPTLGRAREIIARLPADRPVVVAEVGVWQGQLSYQLLRSLPQLSLFMVDRWAAVPAGHPYRASGAVIAGHGPEMFDLALSKARRIADAYASRVTLIREESTDAAQHLADRSLDLVFIDADHRQPAVAADLAAWAPKVKPGGIVAGHDWDNRPDAWGVRAAVEAWALEQPAPLEIETGADHTFSVRLPPEAPPEAPPC